MRKQKARRTKAKRKKKRRARGTAPAAAASAVAATPSFDTQAVAPQPAPQRKPTRRAARVRPIKGPLQMGLPLQMRLGFAPEAFVERAPDPNDAEAGATTPHDPASSEAPAAAGEQRSLFGEP